MTIDQLTISNLVHTGMILLGIFADVLDIYFLQSVISCMRLPSCYYPTLINYYLLTGQLLEEFCYFFSTEFDFANCVVNIRHGNSTSIASVLEELKGADYLKTDEGRSCATINDDPTCKEQLLRNVNHSETTSETTLSTEQITEQQKVLPSSSISSSQSGSGNNKQTEFKISPMCVQDPFELVHNLTQNITVSAMKHIIELMKTAHRICTDLNGNGDNSNNNASQLLDLLTVCRSSKKRKSSHCHTFFVEYQDVNLRAFGGSHNVKLSTSNEVFLFIVDSLEREFGFKCEKKSCNSEKDSDSSHTTQPVKMSQSPHSLEGTPAECCTDNGKNSERDQARKSENDKIEDSFSAICTAFQNTWTHSRRERRKSLQPQRLQRNENSETAGKDSLPDEQSMCDPGKCGEPTLQIFSSCKQPEMFTNVVASPILIFQLNVNSSPGKNLKGCAVSMEHAQSSDFQVFGNFYSAYKNFLMGLMIK